ncbi:hypothetical protein [Castellaniella sp. UC4442_H9]
MECIEMDGDVAHKLRRQAEILESRLELLLLSWEEIVREMSGSQCTDIIESLRDAALQHRLDLQNGIRPGQTELN